jgi:hypothetical protein
MARRWAALACPWPVSVYPGSARVLAALCGVSHASARRWLKADGEVPQRYWPVLAADLEARAAWATAQAAELRQAVAQRKNLVDRKPDPVGALYSPQHTAAA